MTVKFLSPRIPPLFVNLALSKISSPGFRLRKGSLVGAPKRYSFAPVSSNKSLKESIYFFCNVFGSSTNAVMKALKIVGFFKSFPHLGPGVAHNTFCELIVSNKFLTKASSACLAVMLFLRLPGRLAARSPI